MADWSILDRDYSCYDYYPYYQEKEQNAPAQCVQEPFKSPSPTLTLLLSPPPQCYQPPKGENPREIRNKAEKQRRDKMNQSVLRLASIVPTVVRPGRKLNKTSVLRLAAHYLRSHQHVFGSSIDRGPEFSLKFTETLLKNLKGFLITTTYKGIVVVISPNVQEYLGYTELELLGQNVFNIIHKDDHQLLRDQLYPRSCTLTQRGELSIPKENDAVEKIADALANERRSFVIRFRKLNQQRSEPPQYISCHVEGSLRKADHAGSRGEQVVHTGRRARSRGENNRSSGNDIVFVGIVRPTAETFVTEGVLESFRMEYRTRHSIDGEIIQCEQRIALVTGYMTHEVSGVNAMNFMHRDDVRWVIIALRESHHGAATVSDCKRGSFRFHYNPREKKDDAVWINTNFFMPFLNLRDCMKEAAIEVCGKGKTSVDLRKHSIKDTGGRSRKKHEDPPKGVYEEVDDIGRGERVYDQHRLVGESCYRLMTKNGQFIYMRTLGWLDVDQNSKAVTSFVCTNTVVAEQEGKQLIKLMKKKFTLMINNNEEPKEEEELSEPENEKQTPPVEDPKQLEKVILHLVTDLPSPKTDDGLNQEPLGNGGTSPHLAIIPPRKEKIHEAIEKSYSVIRSCCSTMVGRKRKTNKKKPQRPTPKEYPQIQHNSSDLNIFTDTYTTNRPIDTVATISNMTMIPHNPPATSTRIPPRHFSHYVDNWNSIVPEPSPPTNHDTYPNNASDDYYALSNLTDPFSSESLFDILNDINIMPLGSKFLDPNSLYTPAPLTPPSPPLSLHGQSSLLIESPVVTEPPVVYQPPVPHTPVSPAPPAYSRPHILRPPVPPEPPASSRPRVSRPPVPPEPPASSRPRVSRPSVPPEPPASSRPRVSRPSVPPGPPASSRPRVPRPPVPPQPPVLPVPAPSTSKGKGKNPCYSNSAHSAGVKRNKDHENTKEQVKKIKVNGEPQLPKDIEEMITREISISTAMERKGRLPTHNILTEGELERILESVEQVDGISSRNFNEVFHFLQDGGLYSDMASEEENQNDKPKDDEKKAEETENKNKKDPYEFNEDPNEKE